MIFDVILVYPVSFATRDRLSYVATLNEQRARLNPKPSTITPHGLPFPCLDSRQTTGQIEERRLPQMFRPSTSEPTSSTNVTQLNMTCEIGKNNGNSLSIPDHGLCRSAPTSSTVHHSPESVREGEMALTNDSLTRAHPSSVLDTPPNQSPQGGFEGSDKRDLIAKVGASCTAEGAEIPWLNTPPSVCSSDASNGSDIPSAKRLRVSPTSSGISLLTSGSSGGTSPDQPSAIDNHGFESGLSNEGAAHYPLNRSYTMPPLTFYGVSSGNYAHYNDSNMGRSNMGQPRPQGLNLPSNSPYYSQHSG